MDHAGIPVTKTPARTSWFASKPLKQALGYLFAVVCLVWVFHDIELGRLWRQLVGINWWWVALAIVFDILSYLCQGVRWQLLLRPIGNVSSLRATQAIYAGLFTNEVLPMRVGELVRTYLISRWLSADFVSVFPSITVERLFDGVWLSIGFGLTAMFVPLPKSLLEAGDLLGGVVVAATALLFYLIFRRSRTEARSDEEPSGASRWKPLRLIGSLVEHLASGLRQIGASRYFYLAFGLSLGFVTFQALAFWLIMWAYGLRLSFWIGFVVLLIVHLGTAIPNAPANVGSYQFFTVLGLTLFGIEKTIATGFSLVVFFLLTVPLWVIGLWAFGRSGTTLAEIKGEISRLSGRSR